MPENLSEKVSVNVTSSVLSEIDLLVDNGYYSNRSDFINQSLHELLHKNRSTIDRIIEKNSTPKHAESSWFIGVSGLTAGEIEESFEANEHFSVVGYGVFTVSDNVDQEKLFSVVDKISVKGKVFAKSSIKEHYGIK